MTTLEPKLKRVWWRCSVGVVCLKDGRPEKTTPCRRLSWTFSGICSIWIVGSAHPSLKRTPWINGLGLAWPRQSESPTRDKCFKRGGLISARQFLSELRDHSGFIPHFCDTLGNLFGKPFLLYDVAAVCEAVKPPEANITRRTCASCRW